ncbi:hypothetical protein G9464_02590 [Halostella sp. JP-L12]|uniref:hypothetical protein n=1 Tax=Halostella TaxID=1843185 RepID=UPI000EF780D9|nr:MULTISPECIES: hypothetical protein [Halostella]NHN46490.1 hypothetical protein [Halostella sp. JP-L12]
MPTIRQYTDETGLYLRSNIEGRFITLQLTPAAEGLLRDLGYTAEEEISWTLLQPLCEQGHVYTNKSGTEVTQETIDAGVSTTSTSLSKAEKQRIEEFLDRHTPRGSLTENMQPDDNSPDDATEADFGNQEYFIKKWSPTDDEYEATVNRLANAGDPEGIKKSVAHHATEHPIQPNRFHISSRGIPVYSFDSNGIPWVVYDFRMIRDSTLDASLFFDIRPGESGSQSITIENEIVEWHTSSDRFSPRQVEDIVTVFPDISYYVHNLVKSPRLGDLQGTATAAIPDGDEDRIEALDEIGPITPAEYGRVFGVPLTLGQKGYGRIRTHTGHTFPFSEDEFEDPEIETGDLVSLDVNHHRGRIYAFNIRHEADDLEVQEFLESWPNWRNWSLEQVRSHWKDDQMRSEPSSDDHQAEKSRNQYTLAASDDACERIEVEFDPLLLFLTTETNDTESDTPSVIENAARTLLKDVIDGDIPSDIACSPSQSVELLLPSDLLSLIDTAIESTAAVESRTQFFNAALQRHHDLGADDRVELTFRVPRGQFTVLERLADRRKMSTGDLGREMFEEGIRTAIEEE